MKKLVATVLAFAFVLSLAYGQEEEKAALSFQAGINLGTDVLPTGALGAGEAWTRLGFQPDLAFGKIGVGLDLTMRFKLYPPDSSDAIEIYRGDWIPSGDRNIFDIYLPKLLYVRYGLKGQDPLFVKLGSIDDLSLGNGFIMSSYNNMRFMPEQRLFGLDLGLDGALFNFPLVGLELVTGNLARFDVVGGRFFVRPLLGTGIPIVKNLQIGATAVVDSDPALHDSSFGDFDSVLVYGLDAMLPILSDPPLSLAAFTETAFEPNGSMGAMLGLGGKIIGIFNYGAQLRFLGAGFIPSYFDANYDIYRAAKADFMANDPTGDGFLGWFASLGTSLLADKIVLNAALDGPFKAIDSANLSQTDFPHAKAIFRIGEDLLGGFFADASYEKYYLGQEGGFFQDLVDPSNAIVGLGINYKTGASVLTLLYNAKWLNGEWQVSSSLQASMKF